MVTIDELSTRAAAADIAMSEVLDRAGVDPTTWWRWKAKRYSPRLDTFNRVAAALDALIAERRHD